jgi:uncharacterized protein
MQNQRLSTDLISLNDMFRQRVERSGGAYVDLWPAFVDVENRFSPTGPDLNGQVARLRTGDGVHFTRAGGRKAAHFTDVVLRRILPETAERPLIAAPTPGADPSPPVDRAALPPELQPGGVERLIDQMARLGGAPEPIAPPVIPVKPIAGPVLQLTTPPITRGGQLAPDLATARSGPQAREVERAFGEGRPPAPQAGRADDFRWPRAN